MATRRPDFSSPELSITKLAGAAGWRSVKRMDTAARVRSIAIANLLQHAGKSILAGAGDAAGHVRLPGLHGYINADMT